MSNSTANTEPQERLLASLQERVESTKPLHVAFGLMVLFGVAALAIILVSARSSQTLVLPAYAFDDDAVSVVDADICSGDELHYSVRYNVVRAPSITRFVTVLRSNSDYLLRDVVHQSAVPNRRLHSGVAELSYRVPAQLPVGRYELEKYYITDGAGGGLGISYVIVPFHVTDCEGVFDE